LNSLNDAKCYLTFDLEAWFQVANLKPAIDRSEWGEFDLRVKNPTKTILELLAKHDATATFFVLGWVAERLPKLVELLKKEGHEVASHGYGHQSIPELSSREFESDIRVSKQILGDITGGSIAGYRAPNFSITNQALETLQNQGFDYDSSYFPSILHDRYGSIDGLNSVDQTVVKWDDDFTLWLVSTLNLFGAHVPWGGGAYFRLMPYSTFEKGVEMILNRGSSFLFYLHTWEIDDQQPEINTLPLANFYRHYTGLGRTEKRLDSLLERFDFCSLAEGLEAEKANLS